MAEKNDFDRDDVELISEETSYDGFFKIRTFILRHKLFKGGWSGEVKRELFMRDPAVGVIAYDPQLDAVMLTEQFRIGAYGAGAQPWGTELIAGIVEPGEDAEDVARREAEEEAGIELGELMRIAEYHSSPGGSSETLTLFAGRADLCGKGGLFGLPEENEDIRATVVSFDDALEKLQNGVINNAHTVIALQWLQLNRERLREDWS